MASTTCAKHSVIAGVRDSRILPIWHEAIDGEAIDSSDRDGMLFVAVVATEYCSRLCLMKLFSPKEHIESWSTKKITSDLGRG